VKEMFSHLHYSFLAPIFDGWCIIYEAVSLQMTKTRHYRLLKVNSPREGLQHFLYYHLWRKDLAKSDFIPFFFLSNAKTLFFEFHF